MTAVTVPNASQDNNFEEVSEEEKNNIYNYLRVLIDHLSCCDINTNTTLSDTSAGKLTKLTVRHLMELASDMCDELERRDTGSSSPLASKPELTTKRNNARIRMAEFSSEKLNNLILEVVQEIDRRKVNFPPFQQSSTTSEVFKKKRGTANDESPQKAAITSKKTKSLVNESNNQETSTETIKSDNGGFNGKLYSGISIDSLDAMIEDLGSLIEKDGNEEFNELKQRYESEISELKQKINKYEKVIIAEKNFEISKLMTKIEETELINARLCKELSSMNEQMCIRDNIIQDQKLMYETLKESLENVQKQISNRAIDALEISRNAARIELVSSNVFSDMNAQNDQIISILADIDECASNSNQKLFLKLLRDIATTSKSFIILFDRVLQVFQSLNVDSGLCKQSEGLKLEYISALSSLLVAGKDFSARPQNCSDFKLFVETFRHKNEALFNSKIKIEKSLQNN